MDIVKWLYQPIQSRSEQAKLVIGCMLASLLAIFLTGIITRSAHNSVITEVSALTKYFSKTSSFSVLATVAAVIFLIVLLEVIIEELVFRLPLALFINGPSSLVPIALILSITSGYFRGGWLNVPLQGVVGLFLSIMFIKIGAPERKFARAYWSCVFVHALLDCIVIGAAVIAR